MRVLICPLFVFLLACGATPQQTARHFVVGTAEVLVVTDAVVAVEYTTHARAALEASSDLASYRLAMAPFDDLERALRTAHSALLLAEGAVNVWDNGGITTWPHAFACVVGALVGLRDLLRVAGVPLPAELVSLLDGVHAVTDTELCFGEGS